MARLLKADIDQLHTLAGSLGAAELKLRQIKAADAASGLGDALPGSGLDSVSVQAGQFIDGACQRVAGKFQQVGISIEQCANTFEETDTHFAEALRKYDVHHAGSH